MMQWLKRLTLKSFTHGIHPHDEKAATRDKAARRLPFPSRLYLPLSQHIGNPSKPCVTVGQEVVRGEPIAEADGYLSVPLHAPATGFIEAIELHPNFRGEMVETIVIKVYEGASQQVLYGADIDVDAMTREEIVAAVKASGIVGLGGAAFPTHVKLAPPTGKVIDTFIVNGCECEPYLTTDHRVMMEQTDNLIAGIKMAMRAVNAERAIIGIEDNKPDAIERLRQAVADEPAITVEAVETKYPQGAEKILIKSLLGREVPSGGHTYDVGVCCNNVGTLAQMGHLLPRGEGLIERVITIDGPAVEKPGNYLVPIGMRIRDILESVGIDSDAKEIILGGPMMGNAIGSLDIAVTKGIAGVLIFGEKAISEESRSRHPCIKCGKCVQACPMHLNPSILGMLAAKRDYVTMEHSYNLNDCFECGSCTFSCPSGIPLVQYFRIAKSLNRDQKKKQVA